MKTTFNVFRREVAVLLLGGVFLPVASAWSVDYEVGPGQKLAEVNDVPWEIVGAGDHVNIHWRQEPYRAKWVIFHQGTERAPIIVHGVPGPAGQLPVIEGNEATTRKTLGYWGGERSIIKLGGCSKPAGGNPAYVTIENLEVRGARPPYRFVGRAGLTEYSPMATTIHIENGHHITIRNCTLTDSANGLFASHDAKDVLVEGCRIYDNGLETGHAHNVYTETAGIIFQYNRMGPLRQGALANNLKDRSAGCVIRYNWIEGGNRELDLVDAEGSEALRKDPRYRETFVYGNVFIEPAGDGNNQIVHYGGDSGRLDWYRKGTLYFYNNTIISKRTDSTVVFSLSSNDEHADCRNNIVYVTAPGTHLAWLNEAGMLELNNNWTKPGWAKSKEPTFNGKVHDNGNGIKSDSPGFVDEAHEDYHLAPGSPCIGKGAKLPENVLPTYPIQRDYVAHLSSREVPDAGTRPLNIGAFQSEK